jgi:hypothetical protein
MPQRSYRAEAVVRLARSGTARRQA